MIDITHKINSLRVATAQAIISVSAASITALKKNTVPKGNVFEAAKAAGMFAVKNTSAVLPHCHPVPVEFTDIVSRIKSANEIEILVKVKTIYKTGCEMEALHGATIAALTMYDMLKPIDKSIEITSVKLLDKTGGKSSFKSLTGENLKAAVLVVSDSVSSGKAKDESGKLIAEKLKALGIKKADMLVSPDDVNSIQSTLNKLIKAKANLIITTGGTGASYRDVTANAVKPLLDKELPGIMEAAREYGQVRTPYAMFSGGTAGFAGDTLIITMPGSKRAVEEYMTALFPYVFHLFKVRKGERHL